MPEKGRFLEIMAAVVEAAKAQGGELTQEEIQEYFKGMALEEEQMDAVYSYLSENRITVKGFLYTVKEEKKEEKDNVYLSMYLKELDGFPKEAPGEIRKLYKRLQNGEEAARKRLIEIWLVRVVELARSYQNQGVFLEDLVQEGNMGLLYSIEGLQGQQKDIDAEEYLKESVCQAMENLIDENMGKDDLENTLLAKTSLLGEASKVLAEDMGRVATVEELSEYTKIPKEEIMDILSLSLDAVKIGNSGNKPC